MARKKHQHVEEHENHERWLISFADYMTLLFALFVVLYAFAQNEKGQSEKIIQGVINSLQYEGLIANPRNSVIFDGGIGITGSNSTIDLKLAKTINKETLEANGNLNAFNQGGSAIQLIANTKTEAFDRIRMALQAEFESGEIELEQLGQQLVIRIHSPVAFAQDSHFLQPKFVPLVSKISSAIADLPGTISVIGHTNASPPDSQLYNNNWELSALRAVSVANILMRNAMIEPHRVQVIGVGASRALIDPNLKKMAVVEISIAQGRASNITYSL